MKNLLNPSLFQRVLHFFSGKQPLEIVVIACKDPRLNSFLSSHRVLAHRFFASRVPDAKSKELDFMAMLEFTIHRGVKDILILSHSDCKATHLANDMGGKNFIDRNTAWLQKIMGDVVHLFHPKQSADDYAKKIGKHSVQTLRKYAIVKKHGVNVHHAFVDLDTKKITFLDD